jgi:crotonobetainyl-CoA:carnitine CoA-transferase CaiB-like acyl-CoA transferase
MAAQLPLADVKIVDLMWAMAGPAATRVLADYGATVVRIESARAVDAIRTIGPFHDGEMGPENSGFFQNMNAGKLGLALDLSHEAGRAVFLDLVQWADVVTESFAPGAMRAWSLDYEALCKVKPDIIMVSSCLMGQSGPMAKYAGFGNLAAAISGFYNLTGWPDRPPAGPFMAYTDAVAPRFTAAAILAALEFRRRTGEGQYIDQSQAESSLHFLAAALLDYTVNRRVQTRNGNRDAQMAPHGVYPTAGDDCWVAIGIATTEQWEAFCDIMQRPELIEDERFATRLARLAHQDELDALVADWTQSRDAATLETLLQQQGVPAHAVLPMDALYDDAQLAHRHHLVELEHPLHGTTVVEGSRFHLSRTPARIQHAAPTLGRHSRYVLETILGYPHARIAELEALGVLQ